MERLLRVGIREVRPGGESAGHHRGRDRPLPVGDGTGPPVAIRFTDAPRPNAAILLDPELQTRRSLHGWRRGGRAGLDRGFSDLAVSTARTPPSRNGPGRNGCGATPARRLAQFNHPLARAPQRRPPLRSRRAALFAVPGFRPAIQLRLFRERRTQSLDDAQLAKKRHLAAKLLLEARQARARHRMRLGRPRPLSRRASGRACHRHHAVRGAAHACAAGAPPKEGSRTASTSACRIIATSRTSSIASSRSACSSMSASAITTPSSANAANLLADDGVMLLHSIGRSEGPAVTNPWIGEIHLPGRLHSGAVGSAARDRTRRAARHRHRNPAPALRRDAARLAASFCPSRRGRGRKLVTTRFGSADFRADVGILSRRRRSAFRYYGLWYSRSSSSSASTPCR